MRARSSFWAQLGPGTFEGAQPLVQQIRAAMLQLLHTHGDPALAAALQRDLEAAPPTWPRFGICGPGCFRYSLACRIVPRPRPPCTK